MGQGRHRDPGSSPGGSDVAIEVIVGQLWRLLDCFASLAMTTMARLDSGTEAEEAYVVHGRTRRAASNAAEIHRRRDQSACRRVGGRRSASDARAIQETRRSRLPRTQ